MRCQANAANSTPSEVERRAQGQTTNGRVILLQKWGLALYFTVPVPIFATGSITSLFSFDSKIGSARHSPLVTPLFWRSNDDKDIRGNSVNDRACGHH